MGRGILIRKTHCFLGGIFEHRTRFGQLASLHVRPFSQQTYYTTMQSWVGLTIIMLNQSSFSHMDRIVLYVKKGITVLVISSITHVPHQGPTCHHGNSTKRGKEANTLFSFWYREFTSEVSGRNTSDVQQERLSRILTHWSELEAMRLDLVLQGDVDLCYRKWSTTRDTNQAMIDKVKSAQMSCSLVQLVDQPTRSQLVEGTVKDSIIDHCYTN